MVLTINTFARSNLKLPLGRHDLSICTGNFNTSVQAGHVVSVYNISAEHLAGTIATVVRTLRSGKSAVRPAVWPSLVV